MIENHGQYFQIGKGRASQASHALRGARLGRGGVFRRSSECPDQDFIQLRFCGTGPNTSITGTNRASPSYRTPMAAGGHEFGGTVIEKNRLCGGGKLYVRASCTAETSHSRALPASRRLGNGADTTCGTTSKLFHAAWGFLGLLRPTTQRSVAARADRSV